MGANAQTTVPTFTAAQVLTADQMNQSARTGVPVFADTTARDAGFGGAGEKTLAEGQLCYLESTDVVQYYTGSAWATVGPIPAFNTRTVVTATNASWPVPTLKSPIVKVTVIGGGGGGGSGNAVGNGGNGGTSTFASGETFAVTAAGGTGGQGSTTAGGIAGEAGWVSDNGGGGGNQSTDRVFQGHPGFGGQVEIAYCDLTGKTTLNLIIGAGGTAIGTSASGVGGRGEIIVEYAS